MAKLTKSGTRPLQAGDWVTVSDNIIGNLELKKYIGNKFKIKKITITKHVILQNSKFLDFAYPLNFFVEQEYTCPTIINPDDLKPSFDINNLPFKVGDSFEETNGGEKGRFGVITEIRDSKLKSNAKEVRYISGANNNSYTFLYRDITHKKFKFFNNGESQKTVNNDLHSTTYAGSGSTECADNYQRGSSKPQYAQCSNLEEREFYYYQGARACYA